MGLITVSSQQLKQTAGDLRQLNTNFRTQVGQLSERETNLAGMWEGQAKTAFHSAFTRDKEQMDRFYAEIEKYCQTLETIAQKYDQAEAANVETATVRKY